MLKYILLLCLILQLGACKDVKSGGGSEEVKKGVETVETKTAEVGDTENVKETAGHVVKKDHPVETKQDGKNVVEVLTDIVDDIPKESIKTEKEEVVKVDEEEAAKETGSKTPAPSTKQAILSGFGDICKVNNQIGTCVASSIQCLGSRGSVLGTLGASGQCPPLSVCCQATKTCAQTSSKKLIFFVNPTTFDTTTSTCDFTINIVDSKVCQIRLDFESFVIASARQTMNVANSPFTCMDDSFQVISPNNEKFPIICGFNTGQHMYIRVNVTNGERSVRLRFNLAGRPGTIGGTALINPQWKIRITQLECPVNSKAIFGRGLFPFRDIPPLAPPGCLQYYPERTGTIRNFGYNPNSLLTANNYIANMDYSICFRRTPTTCGMKLAPGNFRMSGTNNQCTQGDFLTVPEGSITRADGTKQLAANSRVCGTMLPVNTFITSVGSFPLYVHFVTDNVNGNNENGFDLNFEVPPTNNCQ